jgi:hypothetical protein
MKVHYSNPKGFVGRNICYSIIYDEICYGSIVGGSATLHLPGRNEFFCDKRNIKLNNIVNNIFYHVEKINGVYPERNFTEIILNEFCFIVSKDWENKYGDKVIGFESLVELPRTGEIYRRCGWQMVGITKGFTCKRVGGQGSDNWSGKRIWNTKELKPKLVFCKLNKE